MLARPLRRHEAEQGDRQDALPAERPAGLDRGGNDLRVEQPRRRGTRPRGAFEDRALFGAAAGERRNDGADRCDQDEDSGQVRPANTLPNCNDSQS